MTSSRDGKGEMGKSGLPSWLRLILLIIAAANFWRLSDRPLDVHSAVDFRNVYMGQLLLREGANPYDDALLKTRWQELATAEGIEPESQPGFPDNPLLYPPWALPLFMSLGSLPFSVATPLWYLFAFALLLLTLWWAGNGKPAILLDLTLIALAFKGTVHAWIVGQPTFLCFAAMLGSWHFYQKRNSALAGILLGIAAFKPTLVAPLILLFLFRRKGKILGWAVAVGAALWLTALLLSSDPLALHLTLAANVRHFQEILFDPSRPDYPLYFTMTQITEAGVLLEYVFNGAGALRNLLYLLILLPGLGWIGLRSWKGKMEDHVAFLGLLLLFFLCSYHQFYDLLPFLLLFPLWVQKRSFGLQLLLLMMLAPLFLPINGILNQLSLPPSLNFLYFSTPLSVLITGLIFFREEIVDSLRT